ncbi:MAG: molybdopterin cofactor-binding domain-containing protein [Acidobacteriota bacterium]
MSSTPETAGQFATDLRFCLNGSDLVIESVDPTVLLVDWLRSPSVGLTGTKKSCAQGGCGACTVMLSRWDQPQERVEYLAINSCLRPLCSLDGMEITTTEGTGSCRSKLSPVQYRIAKENGSQCGFCTPGFVMNMHAFLATNQERNMGQKEIEDLFDGNLCRCTGYRAILYGMKHFASDWGPEDEAGCLHTVVDPAERVPHAQKVHTSFPRDLKRPPRAVHYSKNGYHWFRPITLEQVHAILAEHGSIAEVKLVGGNTSIGVYDRFVEDPHVLIDISQLDELRGIEVGEAGLSFGSAVTYGELLSELERLVADSPPEQQAGVEALRYMARRTAGTIVRNAATVAGNTMLVVRHIREGEPFPSDMFTALASLDAAVEVSLDGGRSIELPILEFAHQYQDSKELQDGVLKRYRVRWTKPNEYARTYKTALREENAHSIVNAGLRIRFTDGGTVEDAAIVLGGIGPVAFHARSAEKFLIGRAWDDKSLKQTLKRVRDDVAANFRKNRKRMRGLPYEGFTEEYRTHLAESFFYQFFVHVAEKRAPGSIPPDLRSAGERPVRPVSKGKQSYEKYKDEYPVDLPLVKLAAFLQATGEACYTQDIAGPERTMESAVVTSSQTLASIAYRIPDGDSYCPVDVDGLIAYLKTRYTGFQDYVTASDIPKGGSQSAEDPIFATDKVTYFGQCIGVVLATNEQLAIDIAHFISTSCIEYTPAGTAILTIADAIRKKSIFKDLPPYPVHIWKIRRPASDISWTKADKAVIDGIPCRVVRGTQLSGSQIHFYMETQACVAVPGERDEMVVYPSSQSPDSVQGGVRGILAVPASHVDVKIQRVGGGYGGKTTRSPYVASAVAVAAWKHHRPVRLAVRRENDSAMIGHRHPLFSKYAIAIADTSDPHEKGRILGISTDFHADGGATYDCSFVVMDCIQLRCDSAYMVPNYQTSGDVCQTNKASNTAMRSMGLVQGMLAQEDAIEAAAHRIGMLAEDVRAKNLYQQGQLTPFGQVVDYCYLDEVWKRIAKLSDFDRRRAKVEQFNQQNRWRKRGISMIPVKYGSGYNAAFLEQAGALVEVYDEDGSVLLRHGGVEMGQGLLTKVAQIAARELNLPLSLIETSALDTQVVPNPISTGASTGTAFNGAAVQEACRVLRRRLEDYCLDLLQQNGPAKCKKQGINFWDYSEGWKATVEVQGHPTLVWLNIVQAADNDRINLSSQVRFVQQGGEAIDSGLIFKQDASKPVSETVNHFTGFTFSAACTEVEIDVLTGETTVLRADLVYDMGKSLNPAIDIGQVEGAYVQGLGYVLTEDVIFQPDGPARGALNTDNTWRYKVPATTTIPLEFNVDLFPRSDAPEVPENPYDLLSSKEVGEPPLVLAITAYFALKHAVLAARRDRGHPEWFFLEAPATVQRVREACLVEIIDLRV